MCDERMVAVPVAKYEMLCGAAQESAMLRRILHQKLKSYGGIKHNELEDICTMLGMIEEKEN